MRLFLSTIPCMTTVAKAMQPNQPAMSAYNLLNGTYCNENDHLLQEILRKEWGFDGVVVTDWGGDNDRVKGLECGNELEMPSTCGETNLDVKAAVKNGTLKEAVIDEAIDRLIDASMASAKVVEAAPKTFDKVAHHALAQKVAEESIVLLKNKNGILPLKAGTKVALIGDFAKEPRYQGAGSSIVNPLKVDTILDSIKDYPLTSVGYAQGFKRYGKNSNHLLKEAVNLADKADVLLVFIGLDEFSEAEGLDRKHLRLPDNQRELVSALYHTGKPIICVLSCGAPVELPLMDRVNALVHGLREATGLYFKVLDSDDWVDENALRKLLDHIAAHDGWADLYLTNYVYWQGRDHRSQVISYRYLFRGKRTDGTWKNLRNFKYSSNITLHSAMFKTSVLREAKVLCPQHVSYEDNYFVYAPLPYVKNISYVNADLYQYLIGREGQSMESATCIRKYRDFITDGQLIFDSANLMKIRHQNHALFRAMYHHLLLNFVMVPTFALLNGSPESKEDLKAFWVHCRNSNPRFYRFVRSHWALISLTMPGKAGVKAVKFDYKLAHKLVKFN